MNGRAGRRRSETRRPEGAHDVVPISYTRDDVEPITWLLLVQQRARRGASSSAASGRRIRPSERLAVRLLSCRLRPPRAAAARGRRPRPRAQPVGVDAPRSSCARRSRRCSRPSPTTAEGLASDPTRPLPPLERPRRRRASPSTADGRHPSSPLFLLGHKLAIDLDGRAAPPCPPRRGGPRRRPPPRARISAAPRPSKRHGRQQRGVEIVLRRAAQARPAGAGLQLRRPDASRWCVALRGGGGVLTARNRFAVPPRHPPRVWETSPSAASVYAGSSELRRLAGEDARGPRHESSSASSSFAAVTSKRVWKKTLGESSPTASRRAEVWRRR